MRIVGRALRWFGGFAVAAVRGGAAALPCRGGVVAKLI